MAVLVTGGAGYIGSHTVVELLNAGYEVVVLDNLSNSSEKSLDRVYEITGKRAKFYNCDILDKDGMRKVFSENEIDSVIHFAGLKAVGESCQKPLLYYENNIAGSVYLLEVMAEFNVKKIVFSSSATVYGMTDKMPLTEDLPTSANSPYGQTKLVIEKIMQDLAASDPDWSIVLLRYFNPVGAHKSGKIGENPKGIPNNLMPYITQVASGKLECLSIFGDDYPTKDGTGVRDYIHVVDLSIGHLKALDKIKDNKGLFIYNLGTGVGYSVLDLVHAFEEANNLKVNYKIAPRRPGDVTVCYADASKAKKELGWEAKLGVVDMCRDSWNWQKNNPNGYDD